MKKFLTVLLMVAMVLSMAACGTKKADSGVSAKAVFDSMQAQEDANSVSIVFEMNMDDENLAFKMDFNSVDEVSGSATVDMMMNLEGMETGAAYVRLTDVIVEDETVYVNVSAVLDFLAGLDPQFAMVAEYLDLPGDYVKLTMDDLTQFYSDMLGTDVDFAELMEASVEEADDASADAILDVMCRFLDELASKEGSQLTITGDKISIALTEKNLAEFMDALSQVDVEEYLMQYAEAMDKIEGGVDYTAAMQSEVDGWNESIKEAAADIKENGIEEGQQMTVDFTMGTEGKGNLVSASVNVKDEYEDVKMALSIQTSSDKGEAVTVPDNAMTYEEFMELFGY